MGIKFLPNSLNLEKAMTSATQIILTIAIVK